MFGCCLVDCLVLLCGLLAVLLCCCVVLVVVVGCLDHIVGWYGDILLVWLFG